ncbi:glycosyltransferase [Vibrio breoganii]
MKNYYFINSFSNGGAERVVKDILNNNPTQNVAITIWDDIFYEVNSTVEHHVLIKNKTVLPVDLIIALIRLFFLIRNHKIKVINSHLFWANYLNIICSFATRHRTICTHCVSFSSKFKKKTRLYYFHRLLCSLLLPKADTNTFKSKGMLLDFESNFSLKNNRVIYNPLDFEMIKLYSREEVEFVFKSTSIYLLVVGRFHITKSQQDIIATLPYVSENIEVVFLGEGPTFNDCKRLATKLGVSQRTHFMGSIRNPYPYYSQCDLYISSSKSEGFPNALLEAVSLNCYPIAFDCYTGPREILSSFEKILPSKDPATEFDVLPLGIIYNHKDVLSEALNFAIVNKPELCRTSINSLLKATKPKNIYTSYSKLFDSYQREA